MFKETKKYIDEYEQIISKYEPIKFTIGINPERTEQYIEVDIISYTPISDIPLFNSFNPKAEEVIDLRE